MRIFAIGRNYAEHIQELNNERPDEPVIFTKPDTAIIRNNAPFYYPDFSKDIHHEVELVLRICKEGKNIEEKFASKYYDAIGVGIDFTARDIQAKSRSFRRGREERVKDVVRDIGIDAGTPINDIQGGAILAVAAALEFDQRRSGKRRAVTQGVLAQIGDDLIELIRVYA